MMTEVGLDKQFDIAIDIAIIAHRGQKDKVGEPYIKHPLYVARAVRENRKEVGLSGEDVVLAECVALLHDVLEDSTLDKIYLMRRGVDSRVAQAVKILTRDTEESYEDYIDRIVESGNKLALVVKREDLKHNLDTSRGFSEKAERLKPRYLKALIKVDNALK